MKPSAPDADHHVREEYKPLAPTYDRRWSFYVAATARATLARLAIKPDDRVLDVGCGTGVLLQRLNEIYPRARLTGIDPAPEMLAVAAGKLPKTIELHEARAGQLPFDDESFDVVVNGSVLHYFREPMAAVQEMKRVLRDGGQLVITDWCGDFLSMRLGDLYLRLINPAHFKTYRSKELQRLLAAAGLSEIEIQKYKINWQWGLMTASATKNAS